MLRQIWCRANTFALDQFGKVFSRALNRKRPRRFESCKDERLATNFEEQIVPPLNFLRHAGKRKAVSAQVVEGHGQSYRNSAINSSSFVLPGESVSNGRCVSDVSVVFMTS